KPTVSRRHHSVTWAHRHRLPPGASMQSSVTRAGDHWDAGAGTVPVCPVQDLVPRPTRAAGDLTVPGPLRDGEPVPADGALPPAALGGLGTRPFGVYVHVPFCVTRCGYCDFNTYTASELGPGATRDSYAGQAIEEIRLARRVLGPAAGPARTVFFGGGTPTLLAAPDLGAILRAIGAELGLAPDAEVTVEANPESVDQRSLAELRGLGFTRISFGMQSVVGHVLTVLARNHEPGRPEPCVAWARSAGFEDVSLDLIYGTPGERDEDWIRSLRSALSAGPDHISGYALIVEKGTRLAARIRRGELPAPDDDAMADRYLAADELLAAAGLHWYEISNWAASPGAMCRHNLLYWTGGDWWGIRPGAHSHVGGTRWWNVRHPATYAARLGAGVSPGQAREILTAAERRTERIMLATRLATGCPLDDLTPAGRAGPAGARPPRPRAGGRGGRRPRRARGAGRVCSGTGHADPERPAAGRCGHPRPHGLSRGRGTRRTVGDDRGNAGCEGRPEAGPSRRQGAPGGEPPGLGVRGVPPGSARAQEGGAEPGRDPEVVAPAGPGGGQDHVDQGDQPQRDDQRHHNDQGDGDVVQGQHRAQDQGTERVDQRGDRQVQRLHGLTSDKGR